MKTLIYYLRSIQAIFDKVCIRQGNTGIKVWVRWPNVKKCFLMEISNIGYEDFSLRFLNEQDEVDSRAYEDFGQIDNDILFDFKTYQPINLKSLKK